MVTAGALARPAVFCLTRGMEFFQSLRNAKLAEILRRGGVGVIPTDTLYGIVGRADIEKTVERIYRLRKRNLKKPMIILIDSLRRLRSFGVNVDPVTKKFLQKLWSGKVSVILPCPGKKFLYLHRGKKSLAFRLPARKDVQALLKKVGPLVAPSANFEGELPATTTQEAEKYFGGRVDFYVDGGKTYSLPSTLVEIKNGKILVKRKGATEVLAKK